MARLKKRRKGVSSGKPRIGKRKQPRGNSSVMGKWNSRLTPRENYNKLGILGHVNQTAGNVVEKAGGGSSDNGEIVRFIVFNQVSCVVVVMVVAVLLWWLLLLFGVTNRFRN